MDLSERIKRVMELRKINARQWSEATRDAVSRSYINALAGGKRGARLSQAYADALGRAADVSWRWLLTGEGPVEPYDTTDVDEPAPPDDVVYPNRERVAAMAAGRGVPAHIVQRLRDERASEGDMPVPKWIEILQELISTDREVAKIWPSVEPSVIDQPRGVRLLSATDLEEADNDDEPAPTKKPPKKTAR